MAFFDQINIYIPPKILILSDNRDSWDHHGKLIEHPGVLNQSFFDLFGFMFELRYSVPDNCDQFDYLIGDSDFSNSITTYFYRVHGLDNKFDDDR